MKDNEFINRARSNKPITADEANARLDKLVKLGKATPEDYAIAAAVIGASGAAKRSPKIWDRLFGRKVSKKRGADNNN